MSVPDAPAVMTYFEFIKDCVDAAKEVVPSRCSWGMFVSLGIQGPIYSEVYTDLAIDPGGFLGRVSAPDPELYT